MKKILKRVVVIFLRLAISALLIWFLFRQVDGKTVWSVAKNSDLRLLFLGFWVLVIGYILGFLRWKMLLHALKVDLPVKKIISSFAGCVFFNMFLPSSIGGDFVRSIDLSLHTKKTSEVVATVFLDRLSGYVAMVIMVILGLMLGKGIVFERGVLTSILIICSLLVVILLLLFNEFFYKKINALLYSPKAGKLRMTIQDIHEHMHFFRNKKRDLLISLILSMCIQILSPVACYVIGKAVGIDISLVYFIVFIPIISTITLLPISIGGWGVRDVSFVFLLHKIGISKDLALTSTLIGSFFLLIIAALGGLIYVFTLHNRRV